MKKSILLLLLTPFFTFSQVNKFNSDTVGTKPGNITEVNGTILVASHSSQGQAMETQTINSGNSAVFNLDLFSSASDYSVT